MHVEFTASPGTTAAQVREKREKVVRKKLKLHKLEKFLKSHPIPVVVRGSGGGGGRGNSCVESEPCIKCS